MKQSIKLSVGLLLLSFSLFTASFSNAGLYKSIDKDGNISYSQSPPSSGKYTKIKVPKYKPISEAAKQKNLKAKESINSDSKISKENDLVKNEERKNKKIKEENCKISKKNLRLFTLFKRLKNEKGEYYRVSDTERESRIKAAKTNIKQFCG